MTQPTPPWATPGQYEQEPPKAVLYARLYAAGFVVMYVLCVIGGIGVVALTAAAPHSSKTVEGYINGGAMVVVGIPLAILSAYALFTVGKRTKTTWTLHMVLQALGCSSCCCLPLALPVMLQWMKPEVKAWYGAS